MSQPDFYKYLCDKDQFVLQQVVDQETLAYIHAQYKVIVHRNETREKVQQEMAEINKQW